jgi:uncharacterized membrane protein
MSFEVTLDWTSRAVDAAGAAIILGGISIAFIAYTQRTLRHEEHVYQKLRQAIGRSLMLGLEVLVAGDIIRTVGEPTFENLGLLVVIVLVRTFLSFTLEVEITGRWPWQADN